MSCNLTKGRQLSGCYENLGGLKRIYIGNMDDIDSTTVGSDNKITGITLSGTDTNLYKFDLHEKASTDEFNETLNFEIDNSSKSYTQELTLLFNKVAADERDLIKTMASTNVVVIAEDNNGVRWLMGKERGAHLSSVEHGSGAELTARNGATLTLTAEEPDPMYVVGSDVDLETKSVY